jgi:hypothetical protein
VVVPARVRPVRRCLALIRPAGVAVALLAACATHPRSLPDVSVPMDVGANGLPFVGATAVKGASRAAARLLVDSGMTEMIVPLRTLEDLHVSLRTAGSASRVDVRLDQLLLGRADLLDTREHARGVAKGPATPNPALVGSEFGSLGSHLLRHFDVVLDYPARRFRLCSPRACASGGHRVPVRVSETYDFMRTELRVDGRRLGFQVDTGTPFTVVSPETFDAWLRAHPAWAAAPIRYGQDERRTLVIPRAHLGAVTVENIHVVEANKGFGAAQSKANAGPIVGLLGANVLSAYRVGLSYADQSLYVSTTE